MDNNLQKITPRESQSLFIRAFPGWERLRTEVAGALGVPVEQVRGLTEDADPAVRLDAQAFVSGFQVVVDLYIDARRAQVLPLKLLAVVLARGLNEDVAHHDESVNPYGYVLVRANGSRFAADEIIGERAGLHLDEEPGRLRELPRLSVKPSLLLIVSLAPGTCGSCRHANQGTVDFAERHIFCGRGGPPRQPDQLCNQNMAAVPTLYGPVVPNYYYYEPYDGTNCTWHFFGDFRILAEDAEPAMRKCMQADRPLIPAGTET